MDSGGHASIATTARHIAGLERCALERCEELVAAVQPQPGSLVHPTLDQGKGGIVERHRARLVPFGPGAGWSVVA
jgi:hypothetical protein